jgi:ADP-heptose:LPS heptosyltransferase
MLVFRRGSIGDAVVSIPALNHIRQKFAQSEIYCLSNSPVMEAASPVKSVLDGSGLIDGFIDLPPGGGSMVSLARHAARIRELKFEVLIYLSEPSSRPALVKEALFFRLCGIPRMLNLPFASAMRIYRKRNEKLWESEAERLLRVTAGEGAHDLDWNFRFSGQEEKQAQQMLKNFAAADGRIAFSLGAKLPDKDWGDRNWVNVLSEISRKRPTLGLIGIGAKEDFARTQEIMEAWSGPAINLCGASEPRISALTMKGAAFYLGHDSGPMHLAVLVGTCCVAVFSARAKPGVWFPHGQGHRIFYPWDLAGKVTDKAGFRTAGQSIQSIDPAEVVKACVSILDEKGA